MNQNRKKVVILALHLGYGGVENTIVTKASMLVKYFDVEIVSLYKQDYVIPYDIDKRVKITYLMDDVSNREIFMRNLKKLNIMSTIKEGIKAVKILRKKNNLVSQYIMKCDADVIISTRYEFSELLNKFGSEKSIKIHEQHVFDISKRYIDKLDKLNNIDYIMPVSDILYDEYKNKLNNCNKLFFIPLPLNYYPSNSEISSLKGKNLIAIGRLQKVKGFDDLIKVMDVLVSNDKDIKLNLFGDGEEKDNLIKLINEYKLSDNIKLWGFKDAKFIKNYFSDSTLYVMTSHEESFGLVVLEAMSYGVPCIAFDSAKGCLKLIKDSNGFIIENRDINLMAKKIYDYLNLETNNRETYGRQALEVSKSFHISVIEKKWVEFLDSILKSGE